MSDQISSDTFIIFSKETGSKKTKKFINVKVINNFQRKFCGVRDANFTDQMT